MNDEAVYRTAPATPGLLIIIALTIQKDDCSVLLIYKKKYYGTVDNDNEVYEQLHWLCLGLPTT